MQQWEYRVVHININNDTPPQPPSPQSVPLLSSFPDHCAHHLSVGVCLAPHWAQKFGIDLPPPTPFRATLVNSI